MSLQSPERHLFVVSNTTLPTIEPAKDGRLLLSVPMIKREEDGAEVVSTIRRDLGVNLTVVGSGHIVAGTRDHRYKAAIAVSISNRHELLRFRAMSKFSTYKSSLEDQAPKGLKEWSSNPKDLEE